MRPGLVRFVKGTVVHGSWVRCCSGPGCWRLVCLETTDASCASSTSEEPASPLEALDEARQLSPRGP